MTTIADMRKQSHEALEHLRRETLAKLQDLRFQLASNQLKNVREARKARKELARINTILCELSKQEST